MSPLTLAQVEPCSAGVPEAGTARGSHPLSPAAPPDPAKREFLESTSSGEAGPELSPHSWEEPWCGAGEAEAAAAQDGVSLGCGAAPCPPCQSPMRPLLPVGRCWQRCPLSQHSHHLLPQPLSVPQPLQSLQPPQHPEVPPGAAAEAQAQPSQAPPGACTTPETPQHPPGSCETNQVRGLRVPQIPAQRGVLGLGTLPCPQGDPAGSRAGVKGQLCLEAEPVSAPLPAVLINGTWLGKEPGK